MHALTERAHRGNITVIAAAGVVSGLINLIHLGFEVSTVINIGHAVVWAIFGLTFAYRRPYFGSLGAVCMMAFSLVGLVASLHGYTENTCVYLMVGLFFGLVRGFSQVAGERACD
ncbi:hypothetical protein [Actinomadura sp. WMMA1423]|uniref:hypothetical protein n=1 Tax=Actinomadura sp. WMMA1423 TaxID=2591108 RepID=UPI00114694DF|nr:hypothetical protein [Actinomadura sp. WMMA1423]